MLPKWPIRATFQRFYWSFFTEARYPMPMYRIALWIMLQTDLIIVKSKIFRGCASFPYGIYIYAYYIPCLLYLLDTFYPTWSFVWTITVVVGRIIVPITDRHIIRRSYKKLCRFDEATFDPTQRNHHHQYDCSGQWYFKFIEKYDNFISKITSIIFWIQFIILNISPWKKLSYT